VNDDTVVFTHNSIDFGGLIKRLPLLTNRFGLTSRMTISLSRHDVSCTTLRAVARISYIYILWNDLSRLAKHGQLSKETVRNYHRWKEKLCFWQAEIYRLSTAVLCFVRGNAFTFMETVLYTIQRNV